VSGFTIGRFTIGRRRLVEVVVGFGLTAVLLVWGLPHFAKTTWSAVWEIVARLSPGQAALYLALVLVGLWCYTFTFTASLPGLGHARAFIVNVAGSSVSNLLPGGGAVGLAATFAICRSWGFTKRDVSTSAIVSGVWNVLARILLPIIAVAALATGRSDLPALMRDAAIVAVLSGVSLVLAFAAFIASDRAAATIGRLLGRLARLVPRRGGTATSVEALVADVRSRIVGVVKHGWLGLTVGLAGYFGFYYILFVVVTRSTGLHLFFGQLFAAFALGRLLTSVGVTPGGVGVTETGTAAALVAWGADPAAATAAVVIFSIFTHLMEVPLGALGWLAWALLPRGSGAAVGDDG
jgi:uncharacterized membrane protein YbhN (UPF0104 family)